MMTPTTNYGMFAGIQVIIENEVSSLLLLNTLYTLVFAVEGDT